VTRGEIMPPVIVHGVPRSGTRFLSKVLGEEFDIGVARPSFQIYKYYNLLTHYGDLSEKKNLRNLLIDLSKERQFREYYTYDVDNVIARLPSPDYSSILGLIFSDYAASKKMKMWGLKFDNNLGTRDFSFLEELFPGYKFIHVIRDGRDVNLSTSRVLRTGHYNAYTNAMFWKSLMQNAIKYGSSIKGRYIEVKYEDLLSSPQLECERLARFLGVKNFKYKELDIKMQNFNKWKTEMKESEIRIYEAVAGEMLKEHGYEVRNSSDNQLSAIHVLYLNFENFMMKCLVYFKTFLSKGGWLQLVKFFRGKYSMLSWKIKSDCYTHK